MEHRAYYGHPSQLFGVTEYRLIGGKSDGMRIFHVKNGKGLEFDITADRCADISSLTFDGKNMSYTSVGGLTSPAYYQLGNDGYGFLKSFNCGFLTTCGFQNIGAPNTDKDEFLGLHGTIGNTPADHIYYEVTEDSIVIRAEIHDEIIFGTKLVLYRTYVVSLLENKLGIYDTIKNEGSKDENYMLLYHFNTGYPLLSENAIVKVNSEDVLPRDPRAAEDLDTWDVMIAPVPNFEEQCYYHTFNSRYGYAKIYNPEIEKGLQIKFNTDIFPQMTEWKMMGERDYVLGLEPCTNTLEGRSTIRKRGELRTLKPDECVEIHTEISFYNNMDSWNAGL